MAKELKTFRLIDTSLNDTVIGTVTFENSRIIFKLSDDFNSVQWKKVGVIPYEPKSATKKQKSIHYFINARLPLRLRSAPKREKYNYILQSGLRVASDPYALVPTN
jgi:ABC-type oligopeptide transport system ATPase subunit